MIDNPKIPYIRVGTKYYKIIEVPDIKGKTSEQRIILWSKDNLITDHGKNYHKRKIPKYDAFITVPDHLTYKQVIGNCYNLYQPLPNLPKQGEFPHTKTFLRHVFKDQLNLAFDYFALIYLKPTEILPILALVSKEPGTGKSTLVKWLKAMYGPNMTINTNDEFRSRFNSDWTSKVIIAVEETLLDKREDSERIKNLSTANLVKTEAKGVDKSETPFFGKLILCSNNETNFVYISDDEIRYWVRKLDPIQNGDPFLLEKMIDEIPAFLHYLRHRGIKYQRKSRMWFAPEDIYTEALQKLKNDNASLVEKEIIEVVSDYLLIHELDEICFTTEDIINILKSGGIRQINRYYVSQILQEKWGLECKNSSYKFYYSLPSEAMPYEKKKGRFYTFTRERFLNKTKNVF